MNELMSIISVWNSLEEGTVEIHRCWVFVQHSKFLENTASCTGHLACC